jgi:rubredoxin
MTGGRWLLDSPFTLGLTSSGERVTDEASAAQVDVARRDLARWEYLRRGRASIVRNEMSRQARGGDGPEITPVENSLQAGVAAAPQAQVAKAGGRGMGEYRCSTCGYGIVTLSTLPACPMCHGASWEAVRSPFTARAAPAEASSELLPEE